jgi:protein-tyrosine phosphatase
MNHSCFSIKDFYIINISHMTDLIDPNQYFVSATEILPGFWIGNQRASQDAEFLKKVDVVVNCTKHIDFKDVQGKRLIHLRVPVDDPGNSDHVSIDEVGIKNDQVIMTKYLPEIVENIARCRKRGMKVLVHCHAGMQRSCAVAAAYLMRYGLWVMPDGFNERQLRIMKMEKVLGLIVKKRPVAFNGGRSINFKPALLRFMKLK